MTTTDPSTWNADILRRAMGAAAVSLWSWDVATNSLSMDERGFELWSVAPKQRLQFEDLSERIHPVDRDRVRAAFIATRAIAGTYEIDFRILIGEEIRWISARGIGDVGLHKGLAYGVFLDVTGRKQAEEGHELLAGEMSHRVKNLLAIATGLTQMSSRSSKSVLDMANELTGRLTALGRAHDLVRPLPGHQGTAALLGDLLSILLSPYEDMGAFSGRIRVAVPRMGVGEASATSIALVIHELATNSVKYGSLSVPEGTLDISGNQSGETVAITWKERGGPKVEEPEGTGGFGSRLVVRSITGQLGGSIHREWAREGVIVTLTMQMAKLAS
ncbi:histidine kinase [Bosea sp. AAP35]|uniref:sensor histidine kinase n=1 Tax=Bosea sp. AAP35 TaxID=1523417 RepID=UPI0006B9B041|nr:sensor histidine kinase [Bosea sp. AAP35]KPF72041.1 histidine kinase [Bosea sp. AAP35]